MSHVCSCLQLEAFLLVCAQTWQPQRMCLKVCGQPELVSYQDWAQWETAHTRSDPPPTGQDSFTHNLIQRD